MRLSPAWLRVARAAGLTRVLAPPHLRRHSPRATHDDAGDRAPAREDAPTPDPSGSGAQDSKWKPRRARGEPPLAHEGAGKRGEPSGTSSGAGRHSDRRRQGRFTAAAQSTGSRRNTPSRPPNFNGAGASSAGGPSGGGSRCAGPEPSTSSRRHPNDSNTRGPHSVPPKQHTEKSGGHAGRAAGSASSSPATSGQGSRGQPRGQPAGRGRGNGRGGSGGRGSSAPATPRGGTHVLSAIRACTDLSQLLQLVERDAAAWGRSGNAYALVSALNQAAAKLGTTSPADAALRHRIFDGVATALVPLAPSLTDAAGCTIPLHACAKAGYWGGGLAAALLQRLARDGGAVLATGSGQNLSNMWWAMSEALGSPEGRAVLAQLDLDQLLRATEASLLGMKDLGSQVCANMLLACARFKARDVDRLAQHLTARLVEVEAEAKCQEVANALYALGELAELSGRQPDLEELLGILGVVGSRLWEPEEARRDGFTAQALSNMLLACSKLGCVGTAQDLAAECARRRFARFSPQAFANSVWALAKMGFDDQAWYGEAVAAAEQPGTLRGAVPQDWSNLWYALAVVAHSPTSSRLLERTAEAAGVLRKGATPQACANLLWALANLRQYDERLVDALAGRLRELLGQDPKQLSGQHLCNSLWALAVMGTGALSRHSDMAEGLLHEAARRWNTHGLDAFNQGELTQLWQAQLELAHLGDGELEGILEAAGDGLLPTALAAAEEQAAEWASQSETEQQVIAALKQLSRRLGPDTTFRLYGGYVVPGLGRVTDAAVELAGGRCVAVEVDGPSHFFANCAGDATAVDGPTALRNRQLGRVFGEVLSMPWWQWAAMRDASAQQELLRRRLRVEVY
ncbi:hypothetical protein HYH03_004158 [Edaphochlamys debaryana]|uniref:RAP domain-containing protein n=1 Tax=Edaphochlamys debaryana TaxID=47281 RepID=A0A836C3L0_9CHLO|nr:hypothetical protein HYH03_004158 [Edaphochlamys debaryana]|eukprot:KAG2497892.1 hypothetical protein HYH03_004158 [Edaphochlamys debaryana]